MTRGAGNGSRSILFAPGGRCAALVAPLLAAWVLLVPAGLSCADGPRGLNGLESSYSEILESVAHLECQDVQRTSSPATLTLEQLRQGQLQWREKVHALQVRCTFVAERLERTVRDLEAQRRGRDTPAKLRINYVIAVKGHKLYCQTDQEKSVPTTTAFDGEETRALAGRLSGQRQAGLDLGLQSNSSVYTSLLSIPLGSGAEQYMASEDYVPRALSFGTHYRVLGDLEEVDGFPCHVVSRGARTYWIDPAHGFCVRRMVKFHQTGPFDGGCLQVIEMCKEFKEVVSGVWLPRLCHYLIYGGPNEPEPVRGKLAEIQTIKVHDLQVNDIPDSLFQIKFRPGTLVQDHIANKSYLVPHGEEELERAIAEGKPLITQFRGARSGRGARWYVAAGSLLALLVLGLLAYRWLRSKPVLPQRRHIAN